MDELEARFSLLQDEIAQLRDLDRRHATNAVTMKGWALTVGLASAGFALRTDEQAAAILGLMATLGFWVLDAHQRSTQNRHRQRLAALEESLRAETIADFLSRRTVPGSIVASTSYRAKLAGTIAAARRPGVAALYAAIVLVLVPVIVSL